MTRHLIGLFPLIGIAFLGACGDDAPPPPPPPPVPPGLVAPPAPVVAPPALVPSADQPCIVGRWQANDFLEAIRGNLGQNVRAEGGQLTTAGGTITFAFAAPDATGVGQLVASADDLVHRARIVESGMTINVTHTMTGQATMPYGLPLPGAITVENPTESTLHARVSVNATGIARFNRSSSPRVDLSGAYQYECTPTELRAWRLRGTTRRGAPVVFDRVP